MTWRILEGDSLAVLRGLEAGTVQTCVTSPPYWGLRDYGAEGQMGLEETPDAYVAGMVEVFREVRRVLRDDGTLWLNLGDSYAGGPSTALGRNDAGNDCGGGGNLEGSGNPGRQGAIRVRHGLKPKDLCGIPWRVAFALQADGWYLRSDIIWHKPNPMPESVTDRPTKAHEYVFLMSKSARYFYDADAIKEEAARERSGNTERHCHDGTRGRSDHLGASIPWVNTDGTRNKRSVWTITTKPYPGAHFAVMPTDLVEPCIKAGSRIGDLVLDPFSGAGTVGVVATRQKRSYIGIELNPDYAQMSRRRIEGDAPLFNRGDE